MRLLTLVIAALAAATALFARGADAGPTPPDTHYRDSIADLGFRLYYGDSSTEAEPIRAMLLIAEASHLGDRRADNNLAFILLNGDTAFRDAPRAIDLFRRAADAGLPTAMAQLADICREGFYCAPDTAQAEKLYLNAAARGLRDAELKLIAMNRRTWLNTPADSLLLRAQTIYPHIAPTAAVAMLRIAAIPSDSTATPDGVPAAATARAILADAEARGLGTPYNYALSLADFFAAATLGDPSAQFIIAETLDLTPDALASIAEISSPELLTPQYWYEKAAEHNILDAKEAYRRLLPAVRQPSSQPH